MKEGGAQRRMRCSHSASFPKETLIPGAVTYYNAARKSAAQGGEHMIINTGQRTDIPAFYSEWFVNRLKAGFVCVRNPYDPSQVS